MGARKTLSFGKIKKFRLDFEIEYWRYHETGIKRAFDNSKRFTTPKNVFWKT